MSRSDEDTNELDSYGVWVKHSSGEENLPEVTDEAIGTDVADESLDLPDFDDSDFSDMFKDDNQFSEAANDDFSSDLDSTLSPDELANITNGSGDISIEETPIESDEPDPFADISFDDEVVEETPETTESSDSEEISLDDFGFSDDEVAMDPVVEETVSPAPAEEVSFETTEDEGEMEISLDDFMEDGFSDESVASGNNGFEAGKGPSAAASEEVSLDDFVDMSEFGIDDAPAATPKEEEFVEEAPLEMDISFDSSADAVETEENVGVEADFSDDEEEIDISESFETEEISMDDFNETINTATSSSSESFDTEDIDLSDFGIDSDAEETPIVQDVEEAKNKEVVVDYDLSVGDENMTAAPVVNEIKSNDSDAEIIEEAEEITKTVTAPAGSEIVSTSLLQQIVNDLSGLKDEINKLKSNLAEMKAAEPAVAPVAEPVTEETVEETSVIEEVAVEEPVVEETPSFEDITVEETSVMEEEPIVEEVAVEEPVVEEPVVEETPAFEEEVSIDDSPVSEDTEITIEDEINFETEETQSSGGFFDLDDTDETIALSGDELSNIFNSAEFSEVTVEAPETVSETVESEIETDESSDDLPAEFIDDQITEVSEPVIEEAFIQETISEENEDEIDLPSQLPEENVAAEPVIEENIFEETIEESVDTSIPEEEITFDYENENLEEPTFDEEIVTEDEGEVLPEEISIPKTDDILVETSDDDFMDSVRDTTEIEEEAVPEVEETFDVVEETVDEVIDDISFDTVDSVLQDEEPVVDEVSSETEESFAVEEIVPEIEEPVDDVSFDTVDSFLQDDEPVVEETFVSTDEVLETPEVTPIIEEEPGIEETIVEESEPAPVFEDEPIVEETVVEEPVVEESEPSYEEVDNLDNNLSESNLDYLTTKEEEKSSEPELNTDLKKDIKSVLLYMDQLLENLPEEKIAEFAKSAEFTTYQKLFNELGLS